VSGRDVSVVEWQSSGRTVLAGCLVGAVAAAWLAVALRGNVTVGHLALTPIAAATACGAALLASTLPDLGRADGQASIVLLIGFPVAVAIAAGRGSLDPLLVAGAVVAVAGLWPGADRWLPVARLAGCAGMVVWLVGHTLQDGGRLHVDGRATAAAMVVAAVLLVVASSSPGSAPSSRLLLVPAVLAGVTAAPVLPAAAALVGGAGALGAAAVRRPPAALALLAVAAAAVPAGGPAARLLAAGALIAAALGADVAVLVGLPGAAALAAAIVRAPSTSAAVITAAAAIATAALSAERMRGRFVLDPARVPAVALGAWLLVAPGTWTWAGPSLLATYDHGAARAVAVGLVVLLGDEALHRMRAAAPGSRHSDSSGRRSGVETPGAARHRASVSERGDEIALPPRFAVPTATAAAVLTVACAGWLVLSAIALR
jgi:hypothetical protein